MLELATKAVSVLGEASLPSDHWCFDEHRMSERCGGVC